MSLPNTPSDNIPWPGHPEGVHRAEAMRMAEVVKAWAGERPLAVLKKRFTMSGPVSYAEADWLEMARFLEDVGVDVKNLSHKPPQKLV